MAIVREDARGIYVIEGNKNWRPGGVPGFDHIHNMTEGELKKGDEVRIHRPAGPLCRIVTPAGVVLRWHIKNCDYLRRPVRG